jgi:NTE family protein
MMSDTALVLAGGGVAGIAWETGVLVGIADVDPDLAARLAGADLVIGTSAGSAVAAQLTGPATLYRHYLNQLDSTTAELDIEFDEPTYQKCLAEATHGARSLYEYRMKAGAFACSAVTVDERRRRAIIAARLGPASWPPGRDIRMTAVDAETGHRVAFAADDGVDLVDVVTASCAIPGIWPPATIAGRRYIDGGTPSAANADLAAGCARIVIVIPVVEPVTQWSDLRAEIERLATSRVAVIQASRPLPALFARNPLSPASRRPAAQAGRIAGRRAARWLLGWWE